MLNLLGRGSFGAVYKVIRKRDHKEYVIKKINLEGMTKEERLEAVKETQVMDSLKHENVVRYYQSFIDDDKSLNIVMEYCKEIERYTECVRFCKRENPLT